MCNSDFKTIYNQASDEGKTLLCPICRIEWPKTCIDNLSRIIARSNEDKGWAIELLAMFYNQDFHLKKDSIKAIEYYKRAAEKGEVISCLNLGTMYALGDGVEKDMSKAFFLLENFK